jgi:hypothetical protein
VDIGAEGSQSSESHRRSRLYIYAFLGCPAAISNSSRPYLQADYTILKDELYHHVASTILQQPRLGPWYLCAVKCQERDDLMRSLTPSWAISWDIQSRIVRLSGHSCWYRAGGPEHLFQTVKEDESTLAIRGIVFDEVTWMYDILVRKRFRVAPPQHAQVSQTNTGPYIDI